MTPRTLTRCLLALTLASLPASADAQENPRSTHVESVSTVKMADGAAHVLIDVKLNGKGPYRFILDTGASTTLLDADLVEELGIKSLGTTRIGDPSNPTANEVDSIVIESIEMGEARFEGVEGIGWRGPSLMAGVGARGVIGLPTFRHCLLTIDYPAREVRVSPGDLPAIDGKQVLPLISEPIAEIPLEVAGRAASAHLDIGNASSLIVPESWQSEIATKGELRKGAGMRASGPVEFTIATLDGDLTIGQYVLHDPEIRFDNKLNHVNIGYGVLRRYAVTLDQKHGRVQFIEGATPDTLGLATARPGSAEGRRRLGAALGFRPDGIGEIRMVMPDSPAANAGLLAGDQLVQIDGEPPSNDRMLAALSGSKPIRLRIQRGAEEFDVVLFGEGAATR